MNKCGKCNVNIRDDVKVCPLCGAPLSLEAGAAAGVGYPDVSQRFRLMRFLIKVAIFSSVVAQIILAIIDYATDKAFSWSMITAVGLAFGCFTLAYSFQNNKTLQRKLVGQLLAAIVVLLLLNRIIGHGNWGLSIAVPCAIAAIEGAVVVLLFTDLSHWQVYVMAQVWIVLISIAMLVVTILIDNELWLLPAAAAGFTVVVLAAMVVFGGRHATAELKRRFRV